MKRFNNSLSIDRLIIFSTSHRKSTGEGLAAFSVVDASPNGPVAEIVLLRFKIL